MKRFRLARVFGVFFLYGLLSSGALPAKDKWLRVTSEHFEMLSAAPEKQSHGLMVELEQFRTLFLQVLKLSRAHEPRTTIVVFRNDKAFRPYLPRHGGKPKEVAGYCIGSPGETYVAMSGSRATREYGIIFHEYVHSLISPRCPWMPLWLNEGLAEVFATFKVKGDQVTFGTAHPDAVMVFRHLPPVPMSEFLAVDHESPYYNESERMGVFYSQAWATVHYLLCGAPEEGKNFNIGQLLRSLGNSTVPLSEAMKQGTGMTPDELRWRLRSYIHNGKYGIRTFTVPAEPVRKTLQTRPATEFEVEFALLNLNWRVHDAGDTMARLLAMLEKHPDNPRPHELLAELYARDGQMRSAAGHLRRAVELGSENAFAHVALARMEFVAANPAPDYRFPDAASAELRRWLDRAIELSPDYMEAYETLALVEAFSRKIRTDAIKRVNKNARDIPTLSSRARLLLASAVTLWRARQHERSLEMLDALLSLPDEPVPPQVRKLTLGAPNPVEPMRAIARRFKAHIQIDMQPAP
jgi:tetratricopeptide (TPR) repeat protein